MIPGYGIAEKPTRKILTELARIVSLPETTTEQKIEIAKTAADLNRQLAQHKKLARAQKAKKIVQGKASPFS
jgi:hypothetical protein